MTEKKKYKGNKRGICSVEGCGIFGSLTKTWCTRHYARHLRKGDLGPVGLMRAPNNATPEELIKYHGYQIVGECWEANGFRNEDGYVIWKTEWTGLSSHRAAYRHFHGPIPEGLEVMHSCDNRACMNPSHLSVGTHADNMNDCARKGRSPNAKLSEEQVRIIRNQFGLGKTSKALAEEYGVSPANINLIVKRVNWVWVK